VPGRGPVRLVKGRLELRGIPDPPDGLRILPRHGHRGGDNRARTARGGDQREDNEDESAVLHAGMIPPSGNDGPRRT
jgi:hypothetical protein